jgi:DNA-binding PadR family transcriptional regulator
VSAGFSPTYARLLEAIGQKGIATGAELRTPGIRGVYVVLGRMEDKGLIEASPHGDKPKYLRLTPRGHSALAAYVFLAELSRRGPRRAPMTRKGGKLVTKLVTHAGKVGRQKARKHR